MEAKKIIEKGYFPKELPPSFYTKQFSDKMEEVKNEWESFENSETIRLQGESRSDWKRRKDIFYSKYSTSKCCEFSLSKGKLARRNLKIPNPKHFIKVTELISDNWQEIQHRFSSSEYSTSYPIEDTNPNKRAVRTLSKSVQELRNTIIEKSINKLIQVKVDISKFYPTIYTHTVSWSFLGKEKAKEYFKKTKNEINTLIASGDTNAKLYRFSDELDTAIRACQDKQSIGIPIGPDTSHIVSEIIACRIDEEFKNRFSQIKVEACRYYDDYYLFVNTQDEADLVIKGIQKILNEYQLEVNDKKVEIDEFPFSFENKWVTDLHRFEFNQTNITNSLKHYFSIIWGIGEKNRSRTDWIFKYSLRTFEFGTTKIPKKSWKIFENLLLKTALFQPAILDIVTRILLNYEHFIDAESKTKMKDLIESVIKLHSPVNHSFEITWALWLAHSFDITIEEDIANIVIETRDCTSILVLLCIDKNKNLVQGTPDYSVIENELKDDILFSEYWLLAYEAVSKGWLTPIETNLLENNGFFKILKNKQIEFFDCSRQMPLFIKNEDIEELESDYTGAVEKEPTETIDNGNDMNFMDISNLF